MKLNDKNTQTVSFNLTPKEGYLVKRCHIARIGPMEYAGDEIGKDPGKVYQVYTTADELFSKATIESYEGMPVTLLHPDGLVVNSKNWKDVAIGHMTNVAPNPDGIHLDGDVTVNDATAIEIINKYDIKEISCGQDAEIVEEGGKLKKTRIVGNHVAVVPSARAGSEHRLGDRKMTMNEKLKTLVDSLKKVLGLKIGDAELSADNKAALEAAIAELEAALAAMPEDALPAEVEALKAQIAELQAALGTMADKKAGDADEGNADVAALQEQVAALTAENEALKKENEELKAVMEKDAAIADAAAKFPTVKLGDAKNARAVWMAVLADSKAFTDAEMQRMSDTEIKSAYTALRVSNSQKPTIGKKLLGDNKPEKVDLTSKFGGKKNGK